MFSDAEAGHETFYQIYRLSERSDLINQILKELNFHPLSVVLLATFAQQNRWNPKQLTADLARRRTGVLQVQNLGSLSATIELSLASPMFQELGSDAREVLGVVTFFPHGVDKDNIDKLFPKISDGPSMFDTFCNLSLTCHGDRFIMMLAPLRDYLRPKDPMASPFLLTARNYYLKRLSVGLSSSKPKFNESQWIASEDMNVEHLLDVFTSIDADSEDVWCACYQFMDHLYWHKPRLVVLGSKVKALPDSHPYKPYCLASLSRLFDGVENWMERKRVLIQSLGLWRERGDDYRVAETLIGLSDANRHMGLRNEGIPQAREALEILGRLGKNGEQADCLAILASLLHQDKQLDAASRALELSENQDQHKLCQSHYVLGSIHESKGNAKKAFHHFETSLRIASVLGLGDPRARVHVSLAGLYFDEGKYNDAHTHIELAKSHVEKDMLLLSRALSINACFLYEQNRREEARSEATCALAVTKKLGAAHLVEQARRLLEIIEKELHDNDTESK